jgi:S-adenosylmethionine:tRNA ribosyltransferase-isomerase
MTDELDYYDYHLPSELIAQAPLARRDDARLLVVDRSTRSLSHRGVRDLPALLRPGDCLVLNDTRVVPARLRGRRRQTGGRWQGLFLALAEDGQWRILGQTRGRLLAGESIVLVDQHGNDRIDLRLIEREPGGIWRVALEGSMTEVQGDPWSLLDQVGSVPLPPYIRGGLAADADRQRYQTVYASRPGAVAAPTAGLHFTPELLDRLRERGVALCHVTLHVGPGTFRPVTSSRLADHHMHAESGELSEQAAEQIREARAAGGRIVAVGTTCVRVLETAARSGSVTQWSGKTELFIRPPYVFRAVDALLTNFHLPRSTLLVLVRALGGDELVQQAYAAAVEHRYRFYSYGDAMLVL